MDRNQVISKIVQYFKDNPEIFDELISSLDDWNGYLGDDRWYPMEELNEFYSSEEPIEILYRAFYGYDEDNYSTDSSGNREHGAFNPNRDYFCYNGYGNLVSSDYPSYADRIDSYAVEEIIQNRDNIDDSAITEDEELSGLFDLLEDEDDEE